MAILTTISDLDELSEIGHEFFHLHEKKQLENAYKNFVMNTKCLLFNKNNKEENEENVQIFFRSKVQLFQFFIRTQSINIRRFSQFHQQKERTFIERLFYLLLNNVELTHFSTYNVDSIINVSKELEKYQRITNKNILNTDKLNTIIHFVLSFSSSAMTTFKLNNLFYLLLNDMNDFSSKIIDRIAELLRVYHTMTYGHIITRQYLIETIDNAIGTANYANPVVYPLYENFLNTSYIYKGPFIVKSLRNSSKTSSHMSLYTIIQNLAIILLGIRINDFEYEDQFLSINSEQCYQIRLIIRYLKYLFKKYNYPFEYPLKSLDKQLIIHLVKSILVYDKTYDILKKLLNSYMILVNGFSENKVKRLLCDLLINESFEIHKIETIRYFLKFNNFDNDLSETIKTICIDNKTLQDNIWLTDQQIQLVTHKLYSNEIYNKIFIPLVNNESHKQMIIEKMLKYLDSIQLEREEAIDIQNMKIK